MFCLLYKRFKVIIKHLLVINLDIHLSTTIKHNSILHNNDKDFLIQQYCNYAIKMNYFK